MNRFSFLILLISLLIFSYSFYLWNENSSPPSYEIPDINHRNLNNINLESDFLENLIQKGNQSFNKDFLFVFISPASNCGNCLNEIQDYVINANTIKGFNDNFDTFLIYHGVDSLESKRFILASDINSFIDASSFAETNEVYSIYSHKGIQLENAESLLLILKNKSKKLAHLFVLPPSRTTLADAKKSILADIINRN